MLKMIYAFYVLMRLYRLYSIWPNEIKFEELPEGKLGQMRIIIPGGYTTLVIDLSQNASFKEVFLTVAHEYRHMWQYFNLGEDDYIQWTQIAEKSHLASAIEVDAEVFAIRFYKGVDIQALEIFEDMKQYMADFESLQHCGMRWLLRDMLFA